MAIAATAAPAADIDFEQFVAGEILGPAALGGGFVLAVTNNDPSVPPAALIFDSQCPGGCSADDTDLQTPGFGTGNSTAQGNVLIIAEDLVDREPADGLVDYPDDAREGGTVSLLFGVPRKVVSARLLDIDRTGGGTRLEIDNLDGTVQVVPVALLGNNSAQTVTVPDPKPAFALRIVLAESGAIDDLVLPLVCGDGVVDPGEECDDGNLEPDDCCDDCLAVGEGAPCDDGDVCTNGEVCTAAGDCTGVSGTCGDGVVDAQCAEECDDGNDDDGDCCDTTCHAAGAGVACAGDANSCTDDVCDGSGSCLHVANENACDDGDPCTVGDSCVAGSCVAGGPLACDDDNACTDDACVAGVGCSFINDDTNSCDDGDASCDPDVCLGGVCQCPDGCAGDSSACDDGNPCTTDACLSDGTCSHEDNTDACDDDNVCTENDTCSGGRCDPGTARSCDDTNVCTDDVCDPLAGCLNVANTALCDDDLFCNGTDTCAAGGCEHSGDPCGGVQCQDVCNETEDDCLAPAGTVCDDGDVCTATDRCDGEGTCVGDGSTCGNGTVEVVCGEECEPPGTESCTEGCIKVPFCGDQIIDEGEDCDDANTNPNDGCDECRFESLACFEGMNPFAGRNAQRVVFESHADFGGRNVDGNKEIFLFQRRLFERAKKRGADDTGALAQAIEQLTDTSAPVANELATGSGTARFVAFVSNGDLLGDGSNTDGNKEIFHLDRNREALVQVTDSTGVENLHPSLRAAAGRILIFDSPFNLVPDICIGPRSEFIACTTNADCPDAATCGNPEGNREVFRWLRRPSVRGGVRNQLRQITAAAEGDSVVGDSVNFVSRAATFASTADLVGENGDTSREIYRIVKRPGRTVQVTNNQDPLLVAESPSQARKTKVAFASDANFVLGGNEEPNPNMEIFLWTKRRSGAANISQLTDTLDCTNAAPSIDGTGRFVAFQSTCSLIPGRTNDSQSVFLYDIKKQTLISEIVLRGPGGAPASNPIITHRVRVITFEADPGGDAPNVVCIFNARKGQFEIGAD